MDLGTTSVAGYLCDLTSGRLLAADACVNPQRRFGEDVISRICRINEKDTYLDQFQRLAAGGVDFILQRCLKQAGASIDAIDEIALCGNTTMQQVFAGLHPHGLGSYPYFPLTLIPPLASAGDLGLSCASTVPVFLMPVVSGFVGGDTMAAILADRPHERDEVTLIVDIGTNGELVLGSRKGLWVTSCATGPALEGAQISCGMRAVSGAIHRMWPDADNGRVTYDVLGEENGIKPMGICGSGIIDAIASMRHLGIILPSGRLDAADERVVRDDQGVGRSYTIVDRQQTATGSDISVTLKDIRQIQLAKGALCVGIEFLMRKAGIEKIDRTVLTGAFGAISTGKMPWPSACFRRPWPKAGSSPRTTWPAWGWSWPCWTASCAPRPAVCAAGCATWNWPPRPTSPWPLPWPRPFPNRRPNTRIKKSYATTAVHLISTKAPLGSALTSTTARAGRWVGKYSA
ncbi:ASKHA domain-containing protein [Desulfosarcina cetonica]|uniref:ASKHA domain-containing protein n=1 Tax=Desulfosarcina cetonica TaxID=90730 RepID=UPI0006D26DB4|nr:ASKHA domain-containing protein [Desulfosarcina cetonica]